MAGIYATNALPLKADLIAHELPADFLDDLAADKAAFQSAMAEGRMPSAITSITTGNKVIVIREDRPSLKPPLILFREREQ